jgi:hypothetical protein
MGKKILVIGATPPTSLFAQRLREEHGEDIEIYTPEEAKEKGLGMEDFDNIPTFKITAPPPAEMPTVHYGEYKDGRQLRRERRKNKKK